MSDELLELPEGWEWTDVKSISSVITGKTPSTSNADFWDGGIPFVTPSQIDPSGSILPPNRTLTDLGAAQARIISENSTLAVCIGTVGKIGLLDRPSVINQQLNALTPNKNIHAKFLYYWSQYFLRSWIIENASATVNAAILNKSRLENAPVILPPLNEQRRIVAKIEELRERSQKARSHLSAIPNLCNKFRQSVLAAAFRGDLTADWREQNPDVEPASVLLERIRRDRHDRKSPESVDSSQLPELPEGWMWTPLEEIASHRSGIAFKSAEFTNIGIQVIRLSNVYKGQLDLTRDPVFLPDKYAIDSFTLKANDIVVSQTGTRFKRDYGNFVLIPNNCPKLFLNQRLLAVSCHHLINPEYIVFASKLKSYQDHFFSHETGGVNQGNVGVSGVMKGLVPLAPQKEAQILVKRIKTAFEYICRVELIHRRNEDNLNYLDRSILAKAFRGELVEQDPNDEPASVLLDRIRAEREQQAQGKKGKRIMKTTST